VDREVLSAIIFPCWLFLPCFLDIFPTWMQLLDFQILDSIMKISPINLHVSNCPL